MPTNPNQATIDSLRVWLAQLNAYEVYARSTLAYYQGIPDAGFPDKATFVAAITDQIAGLDAQEATIQGQITALGG